jgi:type II secretory pathway pseudopilin PulG
MAILAGAIAPALIRYIDKSRKSNDVSSCKTIKTAVETALGNEDIYEVLTNCNTTNNCVIIGVTPGELSSAAATDDGIVAIQGKEAYGIEIKGCAGIPKGTDITEAEIQQEIGTNIGEKMPKVKYKKEVTPSAVTATSSSATGFKPTKFYAVISPKGTVYVFIGANDFNAIIDPANGSFKTITNGVQICPDMDKQYQ